MVVCAPLGTATVARTRLFLPLALPSASQLYPEFWDVDLLPLLLYQGWLRRLSIKGTQYMHANLLAARERAWLLCPFFLKFFHGVRVEREISWALSFLEWIEHDSLCARLSQP